MLKKDTKLMQLSEKIHITVEEMKNLGIENLDHMFLEIYTEQASQLTDSRQQKKVKHPPQYRCWNCFLCGPGRKRRVDRDR